MNIEISKKIYENLFNTLNSINILIKEFQNCLNNDSSDNKNMKYINKIKEKYNNLDVKKKLNFFINILRDKIIFISNKMDHIIKLVKKYNNNYDKIFYKMYLDVSYDSPMLFLLNIFRNIKIIEKSITSVNNIFVDIYTLRRILDKTYVNNVIIYSDSGFMIKNIFGLVNLFDFKIVEICNSKYQVKELNSKIKKMKCNEDYIYKI
jgi:hypothetical protein